MKKGIAFVVVLLLGTVGTFSAEGEAGGRVLLIPREGESRDLDYMLVEEVGVIVNTLTQAGFEVVVASTTGERIKGTEQSLAVDIKLTDVDVADFDGLIMPCMAAYADPAPEAIDVVKKAVAKGIPVAAQFGSVYTLAAAGGLRGKRYALYAQPGKEAEALFVNATYSGNGIVQDGAIITSGICSYMARDQGLPDGTPGLTKALISEMTE
jgi:putative intracellular protease/amidase